MAGIGVDIASVINELGVLATVIKEINGSVQTSTEKITYEINEQATNTFVREFHLNASFAYNTVINSGDVIQFEGNSYLVSNKTPDTFENTIVEYASVIYKCNLPSTAKIVTWSQTQNPTTYEITSGWTVKKALAYGLIYQDSRNTLLDEGNPVGRDVIFGLMCLVPANYDVAKLDRVIVSPTEYYMVQDIEKYQFPGIHVLTLIEDTRTVYTA